MSCPTQVSAATQVSALVTGITLSSKASVEMVGGVCAAPVGVASPFVKAPSLPGVASHWLTSSTSFTFDVMEVSCRMPVLRLVECLSRPKLTEINSAMSCVSIGSKNNHQRLEDSESITMVNCNSGQNWWKQVCPSKMPSRLLQGWSMCVWWNQVWVWKVFSGNSRLFWSPNSRGTNCRVLSSCHPSVFRRVGCTPQCRSSNLWSVPTWRHCSWGSLCWSQESSDPHAECGEHVGVSEEDQFGTDSKNVAMYLREFQWRCTNKDHDLFVAFLPYLVFFPVNSTFSLPTFLHFHPQNS